MNHHTPDSPSPAQADHDLLLDCPSCALPAEITDRFTLGGAPAPIEHVKLVCVQRHWFTLPVDQLELHSPAQVGAESARHASGRTGL